MEPSAPLAFFLKAAGFGLAVAAPVGPMSLLCMRRCLGQDGDGGTGWRAGLATGAGIALGDACYALVAALGLSGLSGFLLAQERPLHVAAGLFLLYLGLRNGLRRPAAPEAVSGAGRGRPWPAPASALLLTLANPPTILIFAAIFTALAPRGGFDPAVAALTVLGVFTGSMLWWCGLVAALTRLRHRLTPRARLWIDRLAGLFLAGFGLATLRRVF